MRLFIRNMIDQARRVAGMQPVDATQANPSPVAPLCCDDAASSLGALAVRHARIAAAMHMDQAAQLRARMAKHHGEFVNDRPCEIVEISA